jgi:hypothetical protein
VEDINGAGKDFWAGRAEPGGPGYSDEATMTTTAGNERGKVL